MDPISNMVTIIKNGYMARNQFVTVPYSKVKEKIGKKLLELGYIKKVERDKNSLNLKIELSYTNNKPTLNEVKRISKPSLRVYKSSRGIPRILSGRGEVLISTPKGILTGAEAKKQKLGGELLLKIW